MQNTIRIYQVKDKYLRSYAFCNLKEIRKLTGQETLPRYIWEQVYEGSSYAKLSLDEIYMVFNSRKERPTEFAGRSMSVSDLVEISTAAGTELWFCDSFGWKKVEWSEL